MRENTHRLRETAHKAAQILLVVWLVSMLTAAPAVAQTATPTPTPPEDDVAACEFGPPAPGQTVTDPTETVDQLEIVLVNDDSGTMNQTTASGETRLALLKEAVGGFIAGAEPDDELGHVRVHDAALVEPLTTDHAAVNDSVQALEPNSGEQLEGDAIASASEELETGEQATEGATKIIVFVSDGEPNQPQEALDAAETARDNGVVIYSVGIGDAADDQFMVDVAGNDSRYYESPDSQELNEIYTQISEDIEEVSGGDLRVETRSLYQPGATHPYDVTEVRYPNGSRQAEDVTDSASITSSNETILSADETAQTLSATDDSNASTWVRVNATYNGVDGCTNVIVAQPTAENLALLPPMWRISATVGSSTIQAILVALFAGIFGARYSSAFGGLALMQMVMVAAWFTGYATAGITMVSLFIALFVGLNMAANIDYTVRR